MGKKSRIILIGPTCAGKNYLKDRYLKRGFIGDVSYTTRKPRKGEVHGVDYYYLSNDEFNHKIDNDEFYEWIEYDDTRYGTGRKEWDNCEIFIMEANGISKLTEEDRNHSFIIYLNPERMIRENRMRNERHWPQKKVVIRALEDFKRFSKFKDYDMEVINSTF